MLTIVTSPIACYGRGTIVNRPIGRSQPNRLSYFFPVPKAKNLLIHLLKMGKIFFAGEPFKPGLLPISPGAAMVGGPDGAICAEANGCSLGKAESASDGPPKEAAPRDVGSNPGLKAFNKIPAFFDRQNGADVFGCVDF